MNLLVVEDDADVADAVRQALIAAGHTVRVASDGQMGLHLLRQETFHAAILDVGLPGLSGTMIAKHYRKGGGQTPIVMLTARDALPDRLSGFDAGADDYIVKPFAIQELMARLKAVTRRVSPPSESDFLSVGELAIDLQAHEATRSGRKLDLTPREFALLAYLARHEGKTLSRTMLLDALWGYTSDAYANVVDATVARLRKSLDEGFERPLIETVRGVGYKLKAR